jgi:carbon-monoxide dehydrogenase medium subunit
MYDFTYHKAKTVKAARDAQAKAEDGVYLAGGMTLIPTLKQRLAQPSDVIDLTGLEQSGIAVKGDVVVIEAGTCHADVAASPDVQKAIPALAALANLIGDPQVRNKGTLGGSIANNDPAADYPAACLGLGAVIVTDGREIVADEFFMGLFETALEEGEIVTAVKFPVAKRAGYAKFPNPASRYALVGVFAAEMADGVRVAVTGAGPGVFRQAEMEAALAGSFAPSALDGITVSADGLNEDIHAGSDYRAHLVGVMAKRAVEAAIG